MPRDGWERFVRTITPLHYFLCRDCDYRGLHRGRVPLGDGVTAAASGRPLEDRDRRAAAAKLRSTLLTVLLAILLGTAAGIYVHSCRQEQEVSRLVE